MSSLPPRTPSYQPPHPTISHKVGPAPARMLSRDDPIIFFFDAAMVNRSDTIFPILATASEFDRLMALSIATGRPLIFVTTPLELQLIDHWKEKAKEFDPKNPLLTKLRNWCRGAEGRGMVQEFPDMRYTGFAHQYLILSQADHEGITIESCFTEDLEARPRNHRPNFRNCPPEDRDRNDLRLHSMIEAAQALKRRYMNATFKFYLRGQRIGSRYNEIVKADGSCQLGDLGDVRVGRDAENLILIDIDTAIARNISTSTSKSKPAPSLAMPKSFPSGMSTKTGWSAFGKEGKKWLIKPTFNPRFTLPYKLNPNPGHVVRVMVDGDILDGRETELIDIVGRFEENVEIVILQKVEMERKAGGWRRATKRVEAMARILKVQRKTSKFPKGALLAKSRPTLYEYNKKPQADGPYLAGDLAIRVQLGRAIESLEETWQGQRLTVLWATQDYGNGELMRSVDYKDTTTFKVLRVDSEENGVVFKSLIFGGIKDAFKGK